MHKSTNGGVTWTAPTRTITGRVRLAMAPSNSQILYALRLQLRPVSSPPTVRASWTTAERERLRRPVLVQPPPRRPPHRHRAGMHRRQHPLRRSTNSGASQTWLTTRWGSAQKVHQDTHVPPLLAQQRQPLLGGQRRRALAHGRRAARTFANLNSGLTLTQFYDVAIHPDDPARVCGGAQDNSSEATLRQPAVERHGRHRRRLPEPGGPRQHHPRVPDQLPQRRRRRPSTRSTLERQRRQLHAHEHDRASAAAASPG